MTHTIICTHYPQWTRTLSDVPGHVWDTGFVPSQAPCGLLTTQPGERVEVVSETMDIPTTQMHRRGDCTYADYSYIVLFLYSHYIPTCKTDCLDKPD